MIKGQSIFLKSQGRASDWVELHADKNAEYADIVEIDLNTIEPMIAQPHSPDNVVVRKGTLRHKDRPGLHRKLHEFIVSDDGSGGFPTERQFRCGRRKPSDKSRLEAGI